MNFDTVNRTNERTLDFNTYKITKLHILMVIYTPPITRVGKHFTLF
jgi:hypothetical protein